MTVYFRICQKYCTGGEKMIGNIIGIIVEIIFLVPLVFLCLFGLFIGFVVLLRMFLEEWHSLRTIIKKLKNHRD